MPSCARGRLASDRLKETEQETGKAEERRMGPAREGAAAAAAAAPCETYCNAPTGGEITDGSHGSSVDELSSIGEGRRGGATGGA